MIMLSNDLLIALGGPQVSPEGSGEAEGSELFELLLAQLQDAETPGTFLESHILAPQPEMLSLVAPNGTTLLEVGPEQTEQEPLALEHLLDALRHLFPDMVAALPIVPTSVAETLEAVPSPSPPAPGPFAEAAPSLSPRSPGQTPEPTPVQYDPTLGTEPLPPEEDGDIPFTVTQETRQKIAVATSMELETLRHAGHDEPLVAMEVTAQAAYPPQQESGLPSTVAPPYPGFAMGSTPIDEGGAVALHTSEADIVRSAQPYETKTTTLLPNAPLSRNTVLLQLEPPELGTLLVQVSQVDKQLVATFWADSSEVRALLQAHFPALHQMLSQQGSHIQQMVLDMATGGGFAEQFGQFSQRYSASHTFSQGNPGEDHAQRRHRGGLTVVPELGWQSNRCVDITI